MDRFGDGRHLSEAGKLEGQFLSNPARIEGSFAIESAVNATGTFRVMR
jgi:hypothetical protein